ncbi:BREX-1 system adenine-specific DNA-methyltransferase PglX [Fictibacillus terranigra]|uniref:site-specific DNA-methyltransferase (adenine-specific) n=1 Tax=Fictibacillus terranigra TaxID=3058424 RepID=A0ABT8ED64_9BACL|nr:BREX-1 system adenine-specific DNA-methyltransferase PglX [Fictibacillus sp. CENA-BCM004]MDN4075858.1 BREX-1 system adenine-specific DNA-methyltransferase PglX [Fictibacillus sp. CENA-BCM004]
MNKTELKNFAIQSRRQLIDQVKTKALMYGIDEKIDLEIQEQFGQLMINDKPYPLYMKPAFTSLKNQLKQKGFKQLVEEVAYTWFNRIIAIRYMEVHDYLPEKVSVLSSSVGRVDPDILFEYETMDLPIKQEEIRELLHVGDTEGAYRKLFIAQCNALNSILPFLFEQIQDYTELLLPDFLLDAESVIKVLVQNDELTNSFDEIEVIGWLYQYYIAEEKGRVFAQKSKYKKEEIPFATQLFTPKWIVQYMVQNSLGRYWTEAHQEDEDLISNWKYFIKHEEEDFREKIAPYVNKELRVEDIKLLDPAMGSGHILVYAFEVFYQIYEKCGYPERDIPRLIIENNLYGLDIDDRAYQLAAFAVVMKASSYSRRFLRSVEREGIKLNLASIQETNHISDDVIAYIAQEEEGELYNQVKSIIDQYHNAKTYGSLINITERDISFIEDRLEYIQNNPVEDLFYGEQHDIAKEILPALVKQTKIMKNEYDVLVMNPPYMGSTNMPKDLSQFLKINFDDSKSDLFATFIQKSFEYVKPYGMNSMVTMQSWMFLSSYENIRRKIITEKTIINMAHLDSMVMGIAFGTVATVIRNYLISGYNGVYFKVNYNNEQIYPFKDLTFMNVNATKFLDIPSAPIAYWADESIYHAFKKGDSITNYAETFQGIITGDNEKFLRLWHEISVDKIPFNVNDMDLVNLEKTYWIPYNKGGYFKKWYGIQDYVVNWKNGPDDKTRGKKQFSKYYLKEYVAWSYTVHDAIAVRYYPTGFLWDVRGSGLMDFTDMKYYLQALISSKVGITLFHVCNSTISFQVENVLQLPIIYESTLKEKIDSLVLECIEITKKDWDSYEIAWDFLKHPLLNYGKDLLNSIYRKWCEETSSFIKQLKNNEEEINKIFINIYGMNNILDSYVDDKDITIMQREISKDVRDFISYFIGCMMGRYSLDIEGLLYAGVNWNENNYTSFGPNSNGIIHFTESPYFENDIILRLREFLSFAYSPDTVDENIQWLAAALEMKKDEDAEARLRRYFLDEFFVEHCKIYQKRPIYWLVDSGKQKGLRTLIYMHRYQPDTMATIRFEHLQEIQAKYQNEINDLENRLVNPNLSASEKKKLTAEKTSFEKKMDELRGFDKRLAEIANEEIEISLDDGVKVNYEKFYRGGKGVLAKIK